MKKFLTAVLVMVLSFIATACWAEDEFAPRRLKTVHEETATAQITNKISDCAKIETIITVVRKNRTTEFNIGILQTDECAITRITDAYGVAQISDSEFQMTGIDHAKLTSAIKVYDRASNSFFDVFVDMEWVADASSFLGTWNSIDRELGTTKGYHSVLYRPTALSGTIKFNGTTVNPVPYNDWGSLSSVNNILLKK